MPKVGDLLPLPRLPIALLDGNSLDPNRLRDVLLVLYWWASWCPFCAVQSPHIDALWRRQRDRGLLVLGLSIDTRADVARPHLQSKGYGFPSAWLGPELKQIWPKPKGLPVVVVRGRQGRVVMAEAGQLFPEDVEQIARFL